jgi:hypothetical protein
MTQTFITDSITVYGMPTPLPVRYTPHGVSSSTHSLEPKVHGGPHTPTHARSKLTCGACISLVSQVHKEDKRAHFASFSPLPNPSTQTTLCDGSRSLNRSKRAETLSYFKQSSM